MLPLVEAALYSVEPHPPRGFSHFPLGGCGTTLPWVPHSERQVSHNPIDPNRAPTISMSNASTPDLPDIAACAVRGLVLYSLAEFQSGHATTIRVTAEGASFSIADDGRGHAIRRDVAGTPYLKLIYTHLQYPFESGQSVPIQLQGIGMSLINALCAELEVIARRHDATLRLSFRHGHLCDSELVEVGSDDTGNTIRGTVNPQLQKGESNTVQLEQWLLGVVAASPGLKLFFNGLELHAGASGDS